MEKIDFSAGNEKRFADFISGLNEKDKLALISHTDLDGISAARVANEVLHADILKFVNYKDLNDSLIDDLKKQKVKKIVFADLMFNEPDFVRKISAIADVLIIDHHLINQDYNSDKVVFMNAQGYCGAYLCYYLFSKMQNLEKFDWVVACACIADWQYVKNQDWMKKIFDKYGDEVFIPTIEGIHKSEKFYHLQEKLVYAIVYFFDNLMKIYNAFGKEFGNLGGIEKYGEIVEKDLKENIGKFHEEKVEIEDGYFWEYEPKYGGGSLLTNSVSEEFQGKTIVICRADKDGLYRISMRRQDGKVDVSALLQKLTLGFESHSAGGHFKAAGGHILLKDREEFLKRLRNF